MQDCTDYGTGLIKQNVLALHLPIIVQHNGLL